MNRAAGWFLNSGIQEPGGGVARYHRTDLGRNAPVSTEITGYAISVLTYIHGRTGDGRLLDAARQAARFLLDTAWDRNLAIYPFEHSATGSTAEPLAFFFDSGIIVRGLLALWGVTGDAEFLDNAHAAGQSMAQDFPAGRLIHPILRLPSKQPRPYETRWSRSPGCYQLKAAMGWHDLFEATGEDRFEALYQEAVEQAIRVRHEFLPGGEDREKIMDRLHAYCYFLEGLLPDARRHRGILAEGIDRVGSYLREIRADFERSDVYAQLLRIRLLAGELAEMPLDEKLAAEEASAIDLFQAAGGGFWFGRKADQVLPFMNPVSTAFCAQALDMWEARLGGEGTVSIRNLV